jgi:hypothetical protein
MKRLRQKLKRPNSLTAKTKTKDRKRVRRSLTPVEGTSQGEYREGEGVGESDAKSVRFENSEAIDGVASASCLRHPSFSVRVIFFLVARARPFRNGASLGNALDHVIYEQGVRTTCRSLARRS